MSIRGLQQRTGLNRGYLSRVERGLIRTPASDKVLRLAKALNVPPQAITHEEKP